MFLCLQKVSSKITLKQSIFADFCKSFGALFWLYEDFDDRYPKKPVSVAKKDISDHTFIPAYDSTAQDLDSKSHQKWPL